MQLAYFKQQQTQEEIHGGLPATWVRKTENIQETGAREATVPVASIFYITI